MWFSVAKHISKNFHGGSDISVVLTVVSAL